MAGNAAKLWLQKLQNQNAINRALQVIENKGDALPCRVVAVNGSLVTVAFEVDASPWTLPQITIPKAESRWIRVPTQVGDFGVTIPADVYLGGISGQGGGTAQMVRQGNMTSLLFVPCASKSFPSVNTNQAYVSGPQGVLLETEDHKSSIQLNESGITLTFNGQTITFNASGFTSNVAVQVNSTVTATGEGTFNGGHTVSQHEHPVTGIQTGSGTVTSQKPTG